MMHKIIMGTTAVFIASSVIGQASSNTIIYQKDYAKAKTGTEVYKNCQATKFDKGYYFSPGRITVSKIKAFSKLTLKLNLAVTGGSIVAVRVIPYEKKKKLPSFSLGKWTKLSAEYQTLTLNFTLAEKIKGNAKNISVILPLIYRSNHKGTIWIKSIELSASTQKLESTAVLLEKLKKKLSSKGFKVAVKNSRLTARKEDEIRYYKIPPTKEFFPINFAKKTLLGITWLRSGFQTPCFPVGPYIYGGTTTLTKVAKKQGLTLEQYFDKVAADVKAHNCNTIYYANLTMSPEIFKMAVSKARKHGLSVFAQGTGPLYLRTNKDRKYYERVTKPAAAKILPLYKNMPGLIGFTGKEEVKTKYVPLMQEYRAYCKKLLGNVPMITLHNKYTPMLADTKNLPEWFGFDRYRFRIVGIPGKTNFAISTPTDMVRLLRRELAQHHKLAAERGRPLIFVGQSYREEREIKGIKISAKSGYKQISPGVWRGWFRYMPKHGMYLQFWLSVAEGAQGFMMYHYRTFDISQRSYEKHGNLQDIGLVDKMGHPNGFWTEFGECAGAAKPFFPLFKSWFKEGIVNAKTDNKWAFVNSFILKGVKGRFFVPVNTRIATWDKTCPWRTRDQTQLHYGKDRLEGFTPVGPLTFNIQPLTDGALWDLKTGSPLKNKSGNYPLSLKPGRGMIIFQGNKEELKKVRKQLQLK
jgi:hypothetical protein